MRIASLETFVVGNPPPSWGGRYFVFLTLTTDDGVKGVGEVYAATFHPRALVAMIEDVFEREVQGTDPFSVESLFRQVYARGYTSRPDASLVGVLSGIELACWDIVGKAVDRPVHQLLGGLVHPRLRAYTYIYPEDGDTADVYVDPDLGAERAAEYASRGFTALKFDPLGRYTAFDPRQPALDELRVAERYTAAIRDAVGDRCDLLIGTHGQFTSSGAVRLARRLERFDPLWFEEPVPPDSPEAMATVARATSIPIAAGERLTTKYEFARVLATGAASILQPNLGRVGGLLEAKKIAGMAEAFGAQIAPHLYCGPVVGAANVHLAACIPNALVVEGILDWGGFHAEILRTPIAFDEGWVIPPSAAGLGVELDEEVARAHPYEGDELHLVPEREPHIR